MEHIDTDEANTPDKVRDCLVACFARAHKESMEVDDLDEEMALAMATELIKKAFEKKGNDYHRPTKKALYEALDFLKDFSKSFRNPELVAKHAGEMMELIDKLED